LQCKDEAADYFGETIKEGNFVEEKEISGAAVMETEDNSNINNGEQTGAVGEDNTVLESEKSEQGEPETDTSNDEPADEKIIDMQTQTADESEQSDTDNQNNEGTKVEVQRIEDDFEDDFDTDPDADKSDSEADKDNVNVSQDENLTKKEQRKVEKEQRKREKEEEKERKRKEREEKAEARRERLKEIFNPRVMRNIGITASVCAGVCAVVYVGGCIFYSNHFFYGTHIGNFKCSNMTVEQAQEHIRKGITNYKFTIYEKDGTFETITGAEIGLNAVSIGDIAAYKNAQNPFMWFLEKQENKNIPDDIELTFNEEILMQRVNNLKCVAASIASLPGAASGIYYENGQYAIADDGTRDIVSLSMMQEKVRGGIEGLNPDMSLERDGCYVGLSGDDTIRMLLESLNKYVATTVTYQRGEASTLLDGGTIHTWITIGEDYSINVNREAVSGFITELAALYNTKGRSRTFISSATGESVTVDGGDYGWKMDEAAELEQLLSELPSGEAIVREPIYKQTAGSHGATNDLPNTYVEVSISAQKLWLYKDGQLVITTPIVTGNPFAGNATHTGTFTLKARQRHAVLRGDTYETPVSFWMPFNGGEGLHDATWRGAFGGSIYRGGGSHGCVNLPYSAAETIFNNISVGDPVIVY
jgi:hypothetical protein